MRAFLTNRRQRVVLNGCHSEWIRVLSGVPQHLCDELNWPTLQSRTNYLSLLQLFKILRGIDVYFGLAASSSTRANHDYKLQLKPSRINCYRYSFFVKIIYSWNALPSNIASLNSMKRFLKLD